MDGSLPIRSSKRCVLFHETIVLSTALTWIEVKSKIEIHKTYSVKYLQCTFGHLLAKFTHKTASKKIFKKKNIKDQQTTLNNFSFQTFDSLNLLRQHQTSPNLSVRRNRKWQEQSGVNCGSIHQKTPWECSVQSTMSRHGFRWFFQTSGKRKTHYDLFKFV